MRGGVLSGHRKGITAYSRCVFPAQDTHAHTHALTRNISRVLARAPCVLLCIATHPLDQPSPMMQSTRQAPNRRGISLWPRGPDELPRTGPRETELARPCSALPSHPNEDETVARGKGAHHPQYQSCVSRFPAPFGISARLPLADEVLSSHLLSRMLDTDARPIRNAASRSCGACHVTRDV